MCQSINGRTALFEVLFEVQWRSLAGCGSCCCASAGQTLCRCQLLQLKFLSGIYTQILRRHARTQDKQKPLAQLRKPSWVLACMRACVRLPNFVTIRQSHASGTQLAKTVIGLLTTSSPESHFRFHSINTGILKRFGRRRQERLWKKSKSCWLKRFENTNMFTTRSLKEYKDTQMAGDIAESRYEGGGLHQDVEEAAGQICPCQKVDNKTRPGK